MEEDCPGFFKNKSSKNNAIYFTNCCSTKTIRRNRNLCTAKTSEEIDKLSPLHTEEPTKAVTGVLETPFL